MTTTSNTLNVWTHLNAPYCGKAINKLIKIPAESCAQSFDTVFLVYAFAAAATANASAGICYIDQVICFSKTSESSGGLFDINESHRST